MPDYTVRSVTEEMMDDFSITDATLSGALDGLRRVNRFLGGYTTALKPIKPYLLHHARDPRRPVRILDVGTGIADIPEYLVRWTTRHGLFAEFVGVDANPSTVAYARSALDDRLPGNLRRHLRIDVANALDLPYEPGAFDLVMSSMFMHHLDHQTAVEHLASMSRIAAVGIVVNDLHRHPLAYRSIRLLAPFFSGSPMFRHDGPVSVLRGFQRSELHDIARRAGLERHRISWHWAFRWCLTTVDG